MKADFYETLGVAKGADEAALKSAYRKQAMKFHPDRNQGDASAEGKFKEVNEAYETLKDPQKRAAYDRFGHAAFEQGGANGGQGFAGGGGFADIFEDIFGEMMGGRRRSGAANGRERGADLRYNMEVSLEEAYAGKTAQIRVPSAVSCDECSGTGAKKGTQASTCGTCGGAGRGAGLFLHRAHLPHLQRPRPGDQDAVPQMRWRRAHHAGAGAVGQHSLRH
jgi:molecular chaperone DnaJ